MSKDRYVLNEIDEIILERLKRAITEDVELLIERGVRKTNIEIELMHHIRDIISEE